MNRKRILAAVHLYPPKHLCGGEMYLHRLLKHLQSQGAEVRVLLLNAGFYNIDRVYMYDGIEVFPNQKDVILACFEWAKLVVTHLDYTNEVIHMAKIHRTPVLHLVHNTHVRQDISEQKNGQLIVYNSEWAKHTVNYSHPGTVLHPPVDWRIFDDGADHFEQEHITLINLDGNKGGQILQQIAAALPEFKFIGVTGSYSEPLKYGQYTQQPPNVEVLPKQLDIKKVYARTKLLIMPSKYESWGMTATEAMCSGIPVISSGTPGLKENCGDAGHYVTDREDITQWVNKINILMKNRKEYAKSSKAARARSRELDPLAELQKVSDWLDSVCFYPDTKRVTVSTVSP